MAVWWFWTSEPNKCCVQQYWNLSSFGSEMEIYEIITVDTNLLETFPAFFAGLELVNSLSLPWICVFSHSCTRYIVLTLWNSTVLDSAARVSFICVKTVFFSISYKCIFWTWPPFSCNRLNYLSNYQKSWGPFSGSNVLMVFLVQFQLLISLVLS